MNEKDLQDRVQFVIDGFAGLSTDDIDTVLERALRELAETRMDVSLDDANHLFSLAEQIREL